MELDYITNDFETEGQVPDGLANAVAKGLQVYARTGDEGRAVEVKEAYRTASAMDSMGADCSQALFDAATLLEKGQNDKAAEMFKSIGESLNRSCNTERDAILALEAVDEHSPD